VVPRDLRVHQVPNGAVTERHIMAPPVAQELMVVWASQPWGLHTEGMVEDQDPWAHKDRYTYLQFFNDSCLCIFTAGKK
jgi:hypothetical protein